ncbi:LLM class flavin-dependent oxidoreductase [Streptomyces clavifer]|uniref:LLM class flavin-dependent oxidoreductase n=1 Tax=Streptomyces clavifer TaxID=68188 RepID=UPI0036D040DE
MDVGVMLTTARPDHWTETEVFDYTMDFAVEADRIGYQSAWLLEHHFTRYGLCPNTLTMAGYVLGRTKQIKVGTAVVILPLDHPIRIVEQTNMLDQLSHGRFILGVGRGYFPKDFEAFGVDPAKSHLLQTEYVDIIQQVWDKKTAKWDSDLIKLPDVTPYPEQFTEKPMLYGVGQSPTTIEWAASRGIPLLMPVVGSLESMAAITELYNEHAENHGIDPETVPHAMCSVAHVAETTEKAREEIFENMCWWENEHDAAAFTVQDLEKLPNYRFQYGEWQAAALRGDRTTEDFTQYFIDNSIIGSPTECAGRLERIAEATGVRNLLLGFEATLNRDRIIEVMNTFSDDVLPRLGWKPESVEQS